MKQNIYKEASGDMQKVRLALEKKNDTKRIKIKVAMEINVSRQREEFARNGLYLFQGSV